jgi:Zn-dependent protease with chaperone function
MWSLKLLVSILLLVSVFSKRLFSPPKWKGIYVEEKPQNSSFNVSSVALQVIDFTSFPILATLANKLTGKLQKFKYRNTKLDSRSVRIVEEVLKKGGIDLHGNIHLDPDRNPNACAWGSQHLWGGAGLAVTQGLLDTHNKEELQAVIAHECAHLQHEHYIQSVGYLWLLVRFLPGSVKALKLGPRQVEYLLYGKFFGETICIVYV